MPGLKITEVLLVHCNIVNNNYPIVTNKSFVQLLDISPKKFLLLKTFVSKSSCIEIWFIDKTTRDKI